MKNNLLLVLCFSLGIIVPAQNISINANVAAPDTSSMLDTTSANSGLLIPKMTTAQRDSILLRANALQLFNTSNKALNIYNNNKWEAIPSSAEMRRWFCG